MTNAAWVKLVERATLERAKPSATELDAATAAFQALPRAEQLRLASELVRTRRDELTRAYADVVSVAAGYRLRAEGTPGARVEPSVCVTLVVKRKRPKARVAAARLVPPFLFAYWGVGDQRVLCAVPTDVDDATDLRRVGPLSPLSVDATAPGTSGPAPGVIACAVSGNEGTYAISCRHVFGLALVTRPAKDDARIGLEGAATPFAQGTKHTGQIIDHHLFSFDSQLALATSITGLTQALGNVVFSSRALGWDDLDPDHEAWILTAHGEVSARYAKPHFDPLPYPPLFRAVHHEALARFATAPGALRKGDSGSAVASARGGGKLLGMLIAGDEDTKAFVIPAWMLLQPQRYGLDEGPWEFWPPA